MTQQTIKIRGPKSTMAALKTLALALKLTSVDEEPGRPRRARKLAPTGEPHSMVLWMKTRGSREELRSPDMFLIPDEEIDEEVRDALYLASCADGPDHDIGGMGLVQVLIDEAAFSYLADLPRPLAPQPCNLGYLLVHLACCGEEWAEAIDDEEGQLKLDDGREFLWNDEIGRPFPLASSVVERWRDKFKDYRVDDTDIDVRVTHFYTVRGPWWAVTR